MKDEEIEQLRKRIAALEAEQRCPPHRWKDEGGFWEGYYQVCLKCGATREPIRY